MEDRVALVVMAVAVGIGGSFCRPLLNEELSLEVVVSARRDGPPSLSPLLGRGVGEVMAGCEGRGER